MQVLRCEPGAPQDLRHKALHLAGRVIEFDPDVRGGDGYRIAREILDSGRALAQMNAIIDAQGRRAQAVPVAELVAASSDPSAIGAAFMVMSAVDGETIARKILRDAEYAGAREALTAQLGHALARLHRADVTEVRGLTQQELADVLGTSQSPPPQRSPAAHCSTLPQR